MTDKKAVQEIKNQTVNNSRQSNGKKSSSTESVKQGANRIVDFINDVSDKASDQVADAITAATIQKAMHKIGVGDGQLTKAAIAQFDAAFTEVLVEELPGLTGAIDSPKYLLTSSLSTKEESKN